MRIEINCTKGVADIHHELFSTCLCIFLVVNREYIAKQLNVNQLSSSISAPHPATAYAMGFIVVLQADLVQTTRLMVQLSGLGIS